MTTRRTKWAARSLGLALGLAGGLMAASGEGAEVVVYSARAHYGQEPAMEAFTKKTGIQIKSFGGEAWPLFERLKAEGDKTPADVLISVDAGNLWNAARAGFARSDSTRSRSRSGSGPPRRCGRRPRCRR